MHIIIIAYYPAAALSDSVFRAPCTNSLTYFVFICAPQKFNFLTPTRPIGNFNSNTADFMS